MGAQLETVVSAAQRLVAPEVVWSLPFQRKARGSLDYLGVNPELLNFKRAFDKSLWRAGFPLLAFDLTETKVRYCHFSRKGDLSFSEWKVISALGAETARQRDVSVFWGGYYDPCLWQLRE